MEIWLILAYIFIFYKLNEVISEIKFLKESVIRIYEGCKKSIQSESPLLNRTTQFG